MNTTVWVICPAYNEAVTIKRVVMDVLQAGFRLAVVDDGSADQTARLATEMGADVVSHPINLGQGAALQTGLEYALTRGAEILVTFDADGQHRAADIVPLVTAMRRQGADFALGSRFLGTASNMPVLRRWLLRAAVLFTRFTTGMRLTDAHNGLRAMTRRGASAIRLRQNRMAHASEILSEIARSRLPYIEVPVTIEYSAYSLAKGQRLGDSLMILRDLIGQGLSR